MCGLIFSNILWLLSHYLTPLPLSHLISSTLLLIPLCCNCLYSLFTSCIIGYEIYSFDMRGHGFSGETGTWATVLYYTVQFMIFYAKLLLYTNCHHMIYYCIKGYCGIISLFLISYEYWGCDLISHISQHLRQPVFPYFFLHFILNATWFFSKSFSLSPSLSLCLLFSLSICVIDFLAIHHVCF